MVDSALWTTRLFVLRFDRQPMLFVAVELNRDL